MLAYHRPTNRLPTVYEWTMKLILTCQTVEAVFVIFLHNILILYTLCTKWHIFAFVEAHWIDKYWIAYISLFPCLLGYFSGLLVFRLHRGFSSYPLLGLFLVSSYSGLTIYSSSFIFSHLFATCSSCYSESLGKPDGMDTKGTLKEG